MDTNVLAAILGTLTATLFGILLWQVRSAVTAIGSMKLDMAAMAGSITTALKAADKADANHDRLTKLEAWREAFEEKHKKDYNAFFCKMRTYESRLEDATSE